MLRMNMRPGNVRTDMTNDTGRMTESVVGDSNKFRNSDQDVDTINSGSSAM